MVTPFMGVWIEMSSAPKFSVYRRSLPSWECGLKLVAAIGPLLIVIVTPFMGVWIEIMQEMSPERKYLVTPFMGVWIEIDVTDNFLIVWKVTPFMGVWIEINSLCMLSSPHEGHSLHGSVD